MLGMGAAGAVESMLRMVARSTPLVDRAVILEVQVCCNAWQHCHIVPYVGWWEVLLADRGFLMQAPF